MSKKRTQKKEEPKQKPDAKPKNPEHDRKVDDASTYGGLPDRDLKKNLGCG